MTPGDTQERLADYRAKRDFAVTAEPSGDRPAAGRQAHRFVVQRHRARRLHYDLRLEIDGVLVSWAVPKGPTLDPDARRLAVHVEDHPLDYFDFEGVIPAGEYGGGDVIVWDWGTWALAEGDDPPAAVEAGDLHVDLRGEKLAGRFVLVRPTARGRRSSGCCCTSTTTHAVAGWDPEDHPRSVKSGPHQRRGRGGPTRLGSAHPRRGQRPGRAGPWDPPTDDELAALDALGAKGAWELQGRTLRAHQPRQGAVPRGATASRRSPSASWSATTPASPRTCCPYLHDRAGQPPPVPERRRTARVLAEGGARPRARLGAALAPTRRRSGRDRPAYMVADHPADAGLAGELRRPSSSIRGPRRRTHPTGPPGP